ncbi:hypothetical protein Adt_44671 [Abeliophyllum distichum]|uniref:Uncharacterized protein n=1 Tax=Abeliophyllum distichum TaxID=126358 RepID=A0ABD1PBI2_9LAMI
MGNNKNCFPISLSDPKFLPVEKRPQTWIPRMGRSFCLRRSGRIAGEGFQLRQRGKNREGFQLRRRVDFAKGSYPRFCEPAMETRRRPEDVRRSLATKLVF